MGLAVSVPSVSRPQVSCPNEALETPVLPASSMVELKTLQVHANSHSIDESGEFQSNEYADCPNLNSKACVEAVDAFRVSPRVNH
jgi:hypothetical protein